MQTYAYDYGTYIQICVTDGTEENSFSYNFTKQQDLQTSINESLLLAQYEINARNPQVVAL